MPGSFAKARCSGLRGARRQTRPQFRQRPDRSDEREPADPDRKPVRAGRAGSRTADPLQGGAVEGLFLFRAEIPRDPAVLLRSDRLRRIRRPGRDARSAELADLSAPRSDAAYLGSIRPGEVDALAARPAVTALLAGQDWPGRHRSGSWPAASVARSALAGDRGWSTTRGDVPWFAVGIVPGQRGFRGLFVTGFRGPAPFRTVLFRAAFPTALAFFGFGRGSASAVMAASSVSQSRSSSRSVTRK